MNEFPQTLPNSYTYLHADGTSFFYQHKHVTEIENFKQGICECVRMVF